MRQKLIDFIDWTLKTPVTPLAYLVTAHSIIFSGAFLFFGSFETVQSTLLFQIGALIGVQAWGIVAFIAAIVCMYGLIKRSIWFVNLGSFGLFVSWLFATIAYGLAGLWFQALLSFVTMNYFGYFNLASSMNRLWDYTPYRD